MSTETFEHVAQLVLATCPSCLGVHEHAPGCKAAELSLKPAHRDDEQDLARELATQDEKRRAPTKHVVVQIRNVADAAEAVANTFERLADDVDDDSVADHYIDLADEYDEMANKLRQSADELEGEDDD